MLGRVENVKKEKKTHFFVLNKSQSVTRASTSIFQRLIKNIVFRSTALVTKKLWVILVFFSQTRYFRPIPYPIIKKI